MKTDLDTLKKELSRLTDINYLKKELGRIAGDVRKEVKKFDVHVHLTPQAKERIENLEARFNEVLKALRDLQKQVDSNLDRFVSMVRKRTGVKSRKSAKKSATRKKSVRPKKAGQKTKPTTSRK